MDNILLEGLTFDDVLIMPSKSNDNPNKIDISTNLTKNIKLNMPIISAGMDTVTESRMAIALARQGGIGFIHKNMSISQQSIEVDKVKRSEHGVITDPFFLSPNNYVVEADNLMAKYHISGVPITENGKLVGIITNRDIRFELDKKKKIYEVMTKENLVTAPEGTTLSDAKKILMKHKIEKLPIVDEEYFLKGLITIKDIEKAIKYPNAAKDINGRLLVGASITLSDDYIKRIDALLESKVDVILVDVLNAYKDNVLEVIKQIKTLYKDLPLVAGNVANKEGALALINAGVDCVKVGFGSGSVSTTSIVTGVGVPQLSAIIDCANVCKKHNIPLISSGGIRFSGDVTKAIVAGADAVIIGNLLAGTEESPGKIEIFQGRKYKPYSGFALSTRLEDSNYIVSECVEGVVPFRGFAKDVITELSGGLKSGICYVGASNLKELRENSKFIKISSSSLKECHTNNVLITKEISNYILD